MRSRARRILFSGKPCLWQKFLNSPVTINSRPAGSVKTKVFASGLFLPLLDAAIFAFVSALYFFPVLIAAIFARLSALSFLPNMGFLSPRLASASLLRVSMLWTSPETPSPPSVPLCKMPVPRSMRPKIAIIYFSCSNACFSVKPVFKIKTLDGSLGGHRQQRCSNREAARSVRASWKGRWY